MLSSVTSGYQKFIIVLGSINQLEHLPLVALDFLRNNSYTGGINTHEKYKVVQI